MLAGNKVVAVVKVHILTYIYKQLHLSTKREPNQLYNQLTQRMDRVARLEDGCPQVPETTYYLDKYLFIVMMQMSAATALSPSDPS